MTTTMILIVGLPGSGKSTLAARVADARSAMHLSADGWMEDLQIDFRDEAARARVESLQWTVFVHALNSGVDVVVDWGLWGRDERDRFRAEAAALGSRTEMMYLQVPKDELWNRVAYRNDNLKHGEVAMSAAELDECWEKFQVPSDDEMRLFDKAQVLPGGLADFA